MSCVPRRPLSVTLLACLYIAVGTIGFVSHFPTHGPDRDTFWIELTEVAAIVSGVFMIRRRNWARWLAAAWIVFHVILSVFDAWSKLAVHLVLCALFVWILFRPAANRWFREPRSQSSAG